MTLSAKQKRLFWILVSVTLVIYFAFAAVVDQVRHPARTALERPSPFVQAQPPILPAVQAALQFRPLLGTYAGTTRIKGRVCTARFELRLKPEKPGAFSGYSTLGCNVIVPLNRLWAQGKAAVAPKPTSAILTGTAENASLIRFQVDDVIPGDECAPKAVSVRPFGVDKAVVEWQSCEQEAMILNRTGR
jgi:hypothetical protein